MFDKITQKMTSLVIKQITQKNKSKINNISSKTEVKQITQKKQKQNKNKTQRKHFLFERARQKHIKKDRRETIFVLFVSVNQFSLNLNYFQVISQPQFGLFKSRRIESFLVRARLPICKVGSGHNLCN